MPIAQLLLPEFDREMANTRKLLECVPAGKADWKPHDKSMSLGRLAGHVAELPAIAVRVLGADSLDVGAPRNQSPFVSSDKEELLRAFDKNVSDVRQAITSASDQHMQQPWSLVFKGQNMFTLPRAAAVRIMMMNHLIHHRGQLGVYLRLNNVPIPGMYGPSADFPIT